MLSDTLGIRRDLGPEDDIAAVRCRGREREGGRVRKTKKTIMSQQGNIFITKAGQFSLLRIFMAKKIKPLSECRCQQLWCVVKMF